MFDSSLIRVGNNVEHDCSGELADVILTFSIIPFDLTQSNAVFHRRPI